jgi:ribosomal-protein-alanine N-acetyltransferase
MDSAFAQSLCTCIGTPRLRLEPLTGHHAERAFPFMQNEAMYQWISMRKPTSPDSLREDWQRIESRLSPSATQAWPSWLVVESASGLAVGEVDAEIDDALVCGNLGYYFFPTFWGRGFATEAVTATVIHLQRLGVGPMVATVVVGNLASGQVLRKAGFFFTRVIPGNDTLRGMLVDDEEYVRPR